MSDNKQNNKPDLFLVILVIMFFAIPISWILFGMNVNQSIATKSIIERGQYGDAFGSLNTLFAGLALWAFLYTLYLQRIELIETREVLRKSSDAQEAQTKMNALLALIDFHDEKIDTHRKVAESPAVSAVQKEMSQKLEEENMLKYQIYSDQLEEIANELKLTTIEVLKKENPDSINIMLKGYRQGKEARKKHNKMHGE